MQIAKVTVLYKKGDRNKFGNYRPVSVLPVFSKAFEKNSAHDFQVSLINIIYLHLINLVCGKINQLYAPGAKRVYS